MHPNQIVDGWDAYKPKTTKNLKSIRETNTIDYPEIMTFAKKTHRIFLKL